jgi:hypothetical protein
MPDAEKSVEQEETELTVDEQIMAELNKADEVVEEVEETAEVAEETETETAEETPEEESEAEAEEELLTPHAHWKEEYRESFSGMSRPQQDKWMEREKEFEHGMQAKAAELNQVRGSLQDVQEAVSPFVKSWQMKGVTPFAGLTRALALADELDTNPQQALVNLARERGVNLETAIQDAPYEDPQLAAVRRELQEMREQQESAQQTQSRETHQYLTQTITDFRNETDTTGNLIHPHFENPEVFAQTAMYMKNGMADSLGKAYEMAVAYNPTIQTETAGQKKVTNIGEKQKAADKAKKASKVADSGKESATQLATGSDDEILELLSQNGYE